MRWLWPICKTVAFFGVLAAGYVAIENSLMARGVPPDHVKTFDDFLAWQRDAARFVVSDTKPPQLVAVGRQESLFGSGPAIYLVDEQGRMTAWELESGEGGPVTKLMHGAKKGLDRAGAKTWLEERGR